MYTILRTEINLIAIIILLMLHFNRKRNAIVMLDDRLFQFLINTAAFSTIIDMFTWLIDGRGFSGAHALNMGSNMLYFFTCVFLPYIWVLFAEYRITESESLFRRQRTFFAIPVIAFTILLLTTPFNGWIIYVDENNIYHRGPLYMIQVAISFLYLLYPTFHALNRARGSASYERSKCLHLAGFVILPFTGAVIQVLHYGLPVVSITMVVSILMIFINVQNQQISLDSLTNINNRGQLNRYLGIRCNTYSGSKDLYLIIMDIDHFKHINDTYGHKMGDQVLIKVAAILKQLCFQFKAFPARYGGDEFAIVAECSENEILNILQALNQEIEQLNNSPDSILKLSLSIGYARYDSNDIYTIDQLIEAADNEMYIHKKARHQDTSLVR